MENIFIIGVICVFAGFLYRLFKKDYKDGPCTSCTSEEVCVKEKKA
ncbi:MAG: hypothetical protein WAV30_02505 [Microgenomates group bacterium]